MCVRSRGQVRVPVLCLGTARPLIVALVGTGTIRAMANMGKTPAVKGDEGGHEPQALAKATSLSFLGQTVLRVGQHRNELGGSRILWGRLGVPGGAGE